MQRISTLVGSTQELRMRQPGILGFNTFILALITMVPLMIHFEIRWYWAIVNFPVLLAVFMLLATHSGPVFRTVYTVVSAGGLGTVIGFLGMLFVDVPFGFIIGILAALLYGAGLWTSLKTYDDNQLRADLIDRENKRAQVMAEFDDPNFQIRRF